METNKNGLNENERLFTIVNENTGNGYKNIPLTSIQSAINTFIERAKLGSDKFLSFSILEDGKTITSDFTFDKNWKILTYPVSLKLRPTAKELCDAKNDLLDAKKYNSGGLVPDHQSKKENPLDVQIGGQHYKDLKIQPVEYMHANNMGYIEGAIVKYISRYKNKGGIEDLKKIKHFVDLLIKLEYKQ
jgi:hypothetical protein